MNNRRILRQIAKKYGVSVEEVREDIQSALQDDYKDTTNNLIHQNRVSKRGEILTPEEFINFDAKNRPE